MGRWWWAGAFLVQAALLFSNIDLLPIWGDEQFTLNVIALDWAEIPAVLQADIHPPLYYLLAKAWSQLPLPGDLIERLRALSAMFLLATTLLLAYHRRNEHDWIAPSLWGVAPALVLYGRMGRSYSLQLLVATALTFAAMRFLERQSPRRIATFCALTITLLYIHYLPGVAIPAAVSMVYLWGRQRPFKPLIASWLIIAIAYLLWAWTLLHGIGRVASSTPYRFGSSALDIPLRVGYLYGSFQFGEALPSWALALGLAVGVALLWVHRKAPAPPWSAVVILAGAIAFVAAAQWVSFAFMPGRLLFLYAFFVLYTAGSLAVSGRIGFVLVALSLGMQVVGLGSYFTQSGFFNKAYVIPFDAMAQAILSDNRLNEGVVVIDNFNSDPKPLIAGLSGHAEVLIADEVRGVPNAANVSQFNPLWIARSTNDLSPSETLTAFEEELRASRECRVSNYLAYTPVERWVLNKVGRNQSHHYRLVRCENARQPDQ